MSQNSPGPTEGNLTKEQIVEIAKAEEEQNVVDQNTVGEAAAIEAEEKGTAR